MNILHLTGHTPSYIPPPVLDERQIIAGPLYPDVAEGGRVVSFRTPGGEYDVAELVKKIPADQQPELAIARVGADATNLPGNFQALPCPRVLAISDTHHLANPIRRLLNYALGEPFDFVFFQYTRHHAHFFCEAGLDVFWLPGFELPRIAIEPDAAPDIPLSFVGQARKFHARRHALLRAVFGAGLPLRILVNSTAEDQRWIHARSQINLNCSLNGDFNLRTLEVLASGGFLLTDRISPQAGLDLLLAEGEHFVAYTSVQDCIEKCRALLRDRAYTAKTAQAGKLALEKALGPPVTIEELFSMLRSGKGRPEFSPAADPRIALDRAANLDELTGRIAVYETIQELHRKTEYCRILAMASVDPRVVTDCADLPRFSIAVNVGTTPDQIAKWHSSIEIAQVAAQVELLSDARGRSWDLILATMQDWRDGTELASLLRANPGAALLIAEKSAQSADRELLAGGFIRMARNEPVFCRPNSAAA